MVVIDRNGGSQVGTKVNSFPDLKTLVQKMTQNDCLDKELYVEHDVKRGLRDKNGKGVVVGLTNISTIYPEKMVDGKIIPGCGELRYRGIDIEELVGGFVSENRFGFEEVAYLLLFNELPTEQELVAFQEDLAARRTLPTNFVRDVVMKASSKDIMNSLSRSILTLASYDPKADDISLENVLDQCLNLIAIFPLLAVYAYHAYNHYEQDGSMYIHQPNGELSTAELILKMLRPDQQYTKQEAQTLDMALVLHMEHGGGNNSTFTTRVVTSSGSDTYSTIAAALGSLKGPKHGGANIKVTQMMAYLKEALAGNREEEEIRQHLMAILDGKTFDQKGLIYGMGHAIYSDNDPRAAIFKRYVSQLANEKGPEAMAEFELYAMVERIAPEIIMSKRKIYKGVSANIDFFSGFVYNMLGLPQELYTPIFAIARIVGWSAHRLEELINVQKIMRPAYKEVSIDKSYQKLTER